jgi:hypothetical protein
MRRSGGWFAGKFLFCTLFTVALSHQISKQKIGENGISTPQTELGTLLQDLPANWGGGPFQIQGWKRKAWKRKADAGTNSREVDRNIAGITRRVSPIEKCLPPSSDGKSFLASSKGGQQDHQRDDP